MARQGRTEATRLAADRIPGQGETPNHCVCSVWRPTSFKETVTATCNKQYFVDVYENRGDSKSRVTNRGCLVDGHVAKRIIFHMF